MRWVKTTWGDIYVYTARYSVFTMLKYKFEDFKLKRVKKGFYFWGRNLGDFQKIFLWNNKENFDLSTVIKKFGHIS